MQNFFSHTIAKQEADAQSAKSFREKASQIKVSDATSISSKSYKSEKRIYRNPQSLSNSVGSWKAEYRKADAKSLDSPQNLIVDVAEIQNDIERRREAKANVKANLRIDKNGRKHHLVNKLYWTVEEKEEFARAIREHGKDFAKIYKAVKSKNRL